MQDTDSTTPATTPDDGGSPPTGDAKAADTADPSVDEGRLLEFADAVDIRTTKDHLWATISDPETLTACVPGAESFERVSERKYTLAITRGVSHLTVALEGDVEFVEMNEPDWIVASGFAHDTKTGSDFDVLAGMEMTELDDETVRLSYSAEVTFTGGVASLGPRMLRPIVKRDVNTYFENVRAAVEDR